MDEYANEFDRKNIIFFRDPNRKLGCIPFKFHLTKEYINQFLWSFFSLDFNKFVHEGFKDKIKTDHASSVIGTGDNSVAALLFCQSIYIVNNTQTPSIFITCDLYLRANKSFVREICKIGIVTDSWND